MRVLVTGGTGFIGRSVVAELKRRGHETRVASRSAGAEGAAGVEHLPLDLRHPDGVAQALAGVDAVIHCAAAMSGDLASQREITVQGTRHLLDGLAPAGVRRLVSVSTFAIYDYAALPAGALLDESAPLERHLDQRGPYITTKLEQERLIHDHGDNSRWGWSILRPGIVFGPGRTWFHHLGIQAGARHWVSLAGASRLPLCYVEHCAEALVAAVTSESTDGATINLVDDDLPTRSQYLLQLAAQHDPRPTIHDISWHRLDQLSRTADSVNRRLFLGRLPLPGLLIPASVASRSKPLQYSNALAKARLGWSPRLPFAEAFARSTAAS